MVDAATDGVATGAPVGGLDRSDTREKRSVLDLGLGERRARRRQRSQFAGFDRGGLTRNRCVNRAPIRVQACSVESLVVQRLWCGSMHGPIRLS